ncbi:MAG: hypothetical protein PEPC_01362 [Peptostreptococcus russellii]
MNYSYYIEIIQKLVVTILLLLVYTRISGMRQLSPATLFDSVGNMIVGAIAGTTLLNSSVSVVDSTMFMLIWIVTLFLIRYLKNKFPKMRAYIDGNPIVLIKNGRPIPKEYKRANISNRNLESKLRSKGITGIYQLEELIIEPSGEISYTKKGEDKLSAILIDRGILNKDLLEEIDKTEEWLNEELGKRDIEKVEDVFCAEWNEKNLWIYPY